MPILIESFDDITGVVRPHYLVKPLLETGTTAMLFGPSSGGKTFVSVDLMCCIATGLPWGGMPTRMSHVVYINAEGGRAFGRRVRAWYRRQLGLIDNPTTLATMTANLLAHVHVIRAAIQAGETAVCLDLVDAVRERIPRTQAIGMVVVDTLARCSSGFEENSNDDMTRFVDAMGDLKAMLRSNGWLDGAAEADEDEAHEPVVLLVHHTGKNVFSETTGRMVERGASGLFAALDVVIGLEPSTPVALVVSKMKDGEEPLPMAVTWDDATIVGSDDDGLPIRCRVACVQPPGSARSEEEKKKLAKGAELADLERDILRLMEERPDASLKELADDLDVSKATMGRRVTALRKSGAVEKGRRGDWVVTQPGIVSPSHSPFLQ